jgi:hypothetical protein
VIQIFWPLSRQPSPSLRADVRISSVLVPASGSVSAMQKVASPRTSFGNRSRRISSGANFVSVMPPKIGLHMNIWLSVEPPPPAHSASIASARSSMPRPAPPYSSGIATPHRPASQIACQTSAG